MHIMGCHFGLVGIHCIEFICLLSDSSTGKDVFSIKTHQQQVMSRKNLSKHACFLFKMEVTNLPANTLNELTLRVSTKNHTGLTSSAQTLLLINTSKNQATFVMFTLYVDGYVAIQFCLVIISAITAKPIPESNILFFRQIYTFEKIQRLFMDQST